MQNNTHHAAFVSNFPYLFIVEKLKKTILLYCNTKFSLMAEQRIKIFFL